MKLWYVSKYAKTPTTGLPTRQFFLSRVFAKHGIETTLILSRSNGCRYKRFLGLKRINKIDNIECVLLNGPIISLGISLRRILSWILFELNFWLYFITTKKDEYPDVIIASSLSILTFFTSALIKKRLNCTLILEARDIWPDSLIEMSEISEKNFLIKILRFIELYGYKNADGFVSTLPHFDRYLTTKNIFNFKFKYIPQGFDVNYSSQGIIDKYNEYFPANKFNVCYSGSIGRFNNVRKILEIAKLLAGKDICFIIIGRGPLKNKLIEQSKNLQNIVFLEFIPKKSIVSVISKADLLIFPSKNYPIFRYGVSPNKWIDYMLAGRPILDTHVPNISDYVCMIKDADCAFLQNSDSPEVLASTILKISKLPSEILNNMGLRGREYVLKNLNYDILGSRFVDFINEVIDRK
jgi:glycosyltransferase involved in cell wall biosynthesis